MASGILFHLLGLMERGVKSYLMASQGVWIVSQEESGKRIINPNSGEKLGMQCS